MDEKRKSASYRRIFRSSAILGFGRALSMAIGMIKIKVMALLIGPSGVGIYGIYDSIILMSATITGMGVNQSGIREIAIGVGQGSQEQISSKSESLKKISFLLGCSGAFLLASLSMPISLVTFGDKAHAFPLTAISVSVFFVVLAGTRVAIIQGLGHVAHLAKLNVVNAIIGSSIAIILFLILGTRAILPAIASTYTVYFFVALWFTKKINVPVVKVSWKQALSKAPSFLKLGIALMNAAIISSLVIYLTRLLILRELGAAAVGLYICAYTLSGKFITFITEAIWRDFYPRACSVSNHDTLFRRLINEQTDISLLLAMPGLFATVVFAPWMIKLLYSGSFSKAVPLIGWFVFGCFWGVINRPIQIVQIAKGKAFLCFLTETLCSIFHIVSIYVFVKLFGLLGCSLAYVGHNILQYLISILIAKSLIGFRWNLKTMKFILLFSFVILIAVGFVNTMSDSNILLFGLIGTFMLSLYCLYCLIKCLGHDHKLTEFVLKQPIIGRLFNHGI